jgi:hypothetical protein
MQVPEFFRIQNRNDQKRNTTIHMTIKSLNILSKGRILKATRKTNKSHTNAAMKVTA